MAKNFRRTRDTHTHMEYYKVIRSHPSFEGVLCVYVCCFECGIPGECILCHVVVAGIPILMLTFSESHGILPAYECESCQKITIWLCQVIYMCVVAIRHIACGVIVSHWFGCTSAKTSIRTPTHTQPPKKQQPTLNILLETLLFVIHT